jgi:ribonuclease P protein subunit RPR2
VKQPAGRQIIASKRIEILFEQAEIRPAFAKRYVVLARKMASRHKVRIPQKWKARFCKQCNSFLTPGRNAMLRIRAGRRVITCLECKAIKRMPIKKVKK